MEAIIWHESSQASISTIYSAYTHIGVELDETWNEQYESLHDLQWCYCGNCDSTTIAVNAHFICVGGICCLKTFIVMVYFTSDIFNKKQNVL